MKIWFIYFLKIQIDFFESVFIPVIRQKQFNRGQFSLTPVKNIFYTLTLGFKMPSDFLLKSFKFGLTMQINKKNRIRKRLF